jgi:ankyrin repeat protein
MSDSDSMSGADRECVQTCDVPLCTTCGQAADSDHPHNGTENEYDDEDDMAGTTDLMLCVVAGNIAEVTDHLCSEEPGINKRDGIGYTALVYAVVADHPEIVKLLLENGADANNVGDNGKTPLILAACVEIRSEKNCEEYLAIVNMLLEYGASMEEGLPVLYTVINSGDNGIGTGVKLRIVQCLHINGADVDAKACDGSTALHAAVECDNIHVVGFLLHEGADTTAINDNNLDPLGFAEQLGNLHIANLIRREMETRKQCTCPNRI